MQRDDGYLFNGAVHPDSLSTAVKSLIASDWTPRGLWATATAYAVGDVVEESSTSYVCAVAHTAGTFATDRVSGYWVVLGTYISGGASSVSFSATGSISATNVQAAIAEVAADSLQISNNLSDVASASSARSNLSVPSRADIQLMTYNHAAAAGTVDAITASYTPAVTALTDRLRVSFVASGANTSSTPTFTPNSGTLSAKVIVKGSNSALAAGDIPGGNAVAVVEYNSTLDKWVLLNPASSVNAMPTTGGTFTADVTFGTGAQIFLDDSVTAAGAALPLAFDGDGNTGWYRPAADQIMLATGGTDRMLWDDNGNVTFKTAGGKIKADFSNSSHNSRTIFETTSSNSNTYVGAQASGSGTIAGFIAYQGTGADLAAGNYSFGALTHITATATRLESGKAGTGSYYPIQFFASGVEQVRILATSGATRYITLSGSNAGNPTIDVSGGSLAITPAVAMASSLGVAGDFAVANNKFTVAAASGNTVVAGTLGVTGNVSQTATSVGGTVSVISANADNTNSASSCLHEVQVGGGSGGDPYYKYTVSGVTNWVHGIDNSDSDAWVLSRSATPGTTNILRADSTGLAVTGTGSTTGDMTVGAGSGSPILHINSAASGTANTGPVLKFERNGTQKGIISNRAWLLAGGSTSDDMAYYAESGLGHYFYANGSTTAVTAITSTGLDVTGLAKATTYFSANDNGYIRGDRSGYLVFQGGTTGQVWTNAGNNTDLLTLTQAGNLLVGTTTENFRLSVFQTGSVNVVQFKGDDSSSSVARIWNASTSGDSSFVAFVTEAAGSGTSRGSITYNRGGGVVAYNTTSDYRAKDIDGPLENSGEVIDALKVYKGTMKGATIARPMLIAHEAQEHVPYAVTGEKDAVNDNGDPVYQTMDHQILVPLLISEIQSLRSRCLNTEARLAALEAA